MLIERTSHSESKHRTPDGVQKPLFQLGYKHHTPSGVRSTDKKRFTNDA